MIQVAEASTTGRVARQGRRGPRHDRRLTATGRVRTAVVLGAVLTFLVGGLSVVSPSVTTSVVRKAAQVAGRSGLASAPEQARAAQAHLPLRFELNRGQAGTEAKFVSRGPGPLLHLNSGELVMTSPGQVTEGRVNPGDVVRMQLLGANRTSTLRGSNKLPGVSNYLIGDDASKWVTEVPAYGAVEYDEAYPGIDLSVHGDSQNRLEYDFLVSPGADPGSIQLGFAGSKSLRIDGNGDLMVATSSGEFRQHRPVVYQDIDGSRRPVVGHFSLEAGRVGFEIGSYDPGRLLVIDPVITYSSYLGGTGDDVPQGVATDTSGSVYLTGSTTSVDFPRPEGASFDGTCGTDGDCDTNPDDPVNPLVDPVPDAFVTKLGPDGSLVYSTYLGGSANDRGLSIAVDPAGNAYVAGTTYSADFPTSANGFDRTCGTDGACNPENIPNQNKRRPDGFLTRLSASGSALAYSTYIGGSNDDTGRSDGATYEPRPDNPNEPGAERPASTGLATSQGRFNGSNPGPAVAVAVDRAGGAYVTGVTLSTDFPTTAGALDRTCGTDGTCNKTPVGWVGSAVNDLRLHPDAFVMRFDTNAGPGGGPGSLQHSTYLGGSGGEGGTAVAVDETSSPPHAFVTGFSYSPVSPAASAFPTTANAFQPQRPAGSIENESRASVDYAAGRLVTVPFVTRINPSVGAPLVYSTFFGGTPGGGEDFGDRGRAIAVANGEVLVAGVTKSESMPVAGAAGKPAFQSQLARRAGDTHRFADSFVAKLNTNGSGDASRIYSTYLGGEDVDRARAVAVDADGRAYVVGDTVSSNFPLHAQILGPDDPACRFPADPGSTEAGTAGGCANGFVTVLRPDGSEVDYSTYLRSGSLRDDFATGVALVPAGGDGADHAWVVGSTGARDFPMVNASQPEPGGMIDGFVTRISAEGEGPTVLGVSPGNGNGGGGTSVTIRGSGFGDAVAVDFGVAVSPSFEVNGDGSEILAVTPAGIGTVDVRVTTPNGTSPVNSSGRFTYENGTWQSRSAGPTKRWGHTATLLMPPACQAGTAPEGYPCGKILILGGVSAAASSGDIYDPETDTWATIKPPIPGRPDGHTATLLDDGTVLVVSGTPGQTGAGAAALYKPLVDDWEAVANPLHPRLLHTATLLNGPGCADKCGHVLIVGGAESTRQLDDADPPSTAELYNPLTKTWTLTGPPGVPRARRHTATLVTGSNCGSYCGRVLVVGGSNVSKAPVGKATAELYDPVAGRFSERHDGLVPRYIHTATAVPDGRVLIAGGIRGFGGADDNPTDVVEVFDPSTPFATAFSETGNLLVARSGHVAQILSDGRVAAIGGSGVLPQAASLRPPLASVELFDLLKDAGVGGWRRAASMAQSRGSGRIPGGHTATPVHGPRCGEDCGKVFVFGGTSHADGNLDAPAVPSQQNSLNSSEVLDPGPYISAVTPSIGTPVGGQLVVISGSGFVAAQMTDPSSVTFGGTPAQSFRVESPTRITAVTPPASGFSNADVQVAVPGSGAASFGFFYQEVVGAITDLVARTLSGTEVSVSFTAPGFPTATEYVVKQSRVPITDANFDAALSVCENDVCNFPNRRYRERITLSIAGLVPETTYHYAVRAKDAAGDLTPLSNVAQVTTANVAPEAVTDLVAVADGEGEVILRFSAPGSNAAAPPPARRFAVRQSLAPITSDSFDQATTLCAAGVCVFEPGQVGDYLTLRVTGLERDVAYHYAVRALDEAGNLGPISNLASVVLSCRPALDPAAGQVRYGSGYHLVGLPEGTRVPSISPLFGWFDLGKGGTYSVGDPTQPAQAGHGYWAYFTCPRTVDLATGGPSTVNMPLGEYRASMVGNPTTGDATVSGHDFAARWDRTLNGGAGGYVLSGYRGDQTLAAGEGVWTFSYVPTTVTVAGQQ